MEKESLSRRGFMALGITGAASLAGGITPAAPVPGRPEGPSDRVRVGFVGVGGRGSNLLSVALTNRYAEVTAICDLDESRAKAAADRAEKVYGVRPPLYGDHKKLLEEAKVDAIISATPCFEHYRIYRDAMAAGKHLYGEKPMCVSVKEADDLVAQYEKNRKLKVQVGFQRRANPRYIEGVKLIREDRVLGDLIEGRCAFNNNWAPPEGLGPKGHWLSRKEKSGDWMIEQAVHTWDVMNWVAGATPRMAFGLGHPGVFKPYNPERNVCDDYCAILDYPEQLTIQFSHSWISPDGPAYAGIYDRYLGLQGGIDLGEGKITYSSRSDRKPEDRSQAIQPDVADDTKISVDSFIDCILNSRKPHSTVYNGRNATLVGLLVRTAVYERRLVTWEEMLKTC